MNDLMKLAIGVVIGYQGIKPLTHLFYWVVIVALVSFHCFSH